MNENKNVWTMNELIPLSYRELIRVKEQMLGIELFDDHRIHEERRVNIIMEIMRLQEGKADD